MAYFRSRLLSIPPIVGILLGFVLGFVLGAVQLGVDLYNQSLYATQATQIPAIFTLLLWLCSYVFAGLLVGNATRKEGAGIITGLFYFIMGMLADIIAPILLYIHRSPDSYSASNALTMTLNMQMGSLQPELLMLGLAIGLGYLGSWFGSQQSLRGTYARPHIGIFIVLACAFIALVDRIVGYSLAHILAGRDYPPQTIYADIISQRAGITITCITLCGVATLCLSTFLIGILVGKQNTETHLKSHPIFWTILFGTLTNIGTLIALIDNDAISYNYNIYDIYGQPITLLQLVIQLYTPYLFITVLYLLLGAGVAALLSRPGLLIGNGIRKNRPLPKKDPSYPSLPEAEAEQPVLPLQSFRQD